MTAWFANAGGWLRRRTWSPLVATGYVALMALFLWAVARCYVPGAGFTYFIAFGSVQQDAMISKVRRLHPYVQRESAGYDAQFYAQIAMDPTLQNRELPRAMDSLAYRGRRVLFAATAWMFGLGRPAWILQAFALQNVLGWLLLGVLLLHWFPPRTWDHALRWAGVMFSSGVLISVHNALFDGPSLLLIAFALFLYERGRPWCSAMVLGLAGLGKETNVFGAVALIPSWRAGWRAWLTAAAQAAVIVLPLLLWLTYIHTMVGSAADAGARNFALPFTGFAHKWREVFADLAPAGGLSWTMLIMISVTVQFGFFVLRPRWGNPCWRVCAAFAVLMIFLGDAVWEGYPGAVSRVLLPMQLGFNILVPVGRSWRVLLIAGNLTLWAAPEALQRPPGEVCEITGLAALRANPAGDVAAIRLGAHWLGNEGVRGHTWTWASDSAEIGVDNPQAADVEFDLKFGLAAPDDRHLHVKLNGTEVWAGEVGTKLVTVEVLGLALRPGSNRLEFVTDEPGRKVGSDPRTLAFSLYDARVELRRLLPAKSP